MLHEIVKKKICFRSSFIYKSRIWIPPKRCHLGGKVRQNREYFDNFHFKL